VWVRGRTGRTVLEAEYAAEHVQLAYFATAHGAQGLTEALGATLADAMARYRSLYVGMTRGREHNTAYVVVDDDRDPRRELERALRRDRADLGVLAIRDRLEHEARRAAERERAAGAIAGVPTQALRSELAELEGRIGSYPDHLADQLAHVQAELERTQAIANAAAQRARA
jgi:hypothetical protein